MAPYWRLDFHECRYGYRDVYEVAAVVANYLSHNIPPETIWSDIDDIDRRRIFTIDLDRFPADLYKDLVDTIHAMDQYYIVIVDPAVYYSESNPGLDRGLCTMPLLMRQMGLYIRVSSGLVRVISLTSSTLNLRSIGPSSSWRSSIEPIVRTVTRCGST